MPRFQDYREWNSARGELEQKKDRLEARIRGKEPRAEDIEQLFDAGIRRRVGEMISQAALKSKTRRH